MLVWGSLGCALFFMILGNFTLNLELTGQMPVVAETQSFSPSYALSHALTYLPGSSFWLVFVVVIGTIFTATTYDSAAYTLAAGATDQLRPGQHPERWHRVFGRLPRTLPASLLYFGSLKALQTATLVASVPLLLIYVILIIAVGRTLESHLQEANPPLFGSSFSSLDGVLISEVSSNFLLDVLLGVSLDAFSRTLFQRRALIDFA